MSPLPLDNADLPLFTVGQVASMLEIQQAFLRRLDEHQVVRPSRSGGGQRRYTRNEITVVQYVVQLVDEGMTLNAIRFAVSDIGHAEATLVSGGIKPQRHVGRLVVPPDQAFGATLIFQSANKA